MVAVADTLLSIQDRAELDIKIGRRRSSDSLAALKIKTQISSHLNKRKAIELHERS